MFSKVGDERREVGDPVAGRRGVGGPPLPAARLSGPAGGMPDDRLEQLFQLHRPAMERLAYALCRDRHRAQDLVQETLVKLWLHCGGLDERTGSERGLVLTVLRRACIDDRRRAAARPVEVALDAAGGVSAATPGPESVVENGLVASQLLSSLPTKHREVLVELFLNDRTEREAAGALGLPVGTVKSRAHYALRSLRSRQHGDHAPVGTGSSTPSTTTSSTTSARAS